MMNKRITLLLILMLVTTMALAGCSARTSFTITFDSQGGSAVAPIEARAGEPIVAPTVPTREGYTFGGWYSTAECTGNRHVFSVMGDTSITLYAKWVQTAFDITLEGNGGSGSPAPQYNGGDMMLPDDWVREGFRFAGWWDNAECVGNVVTTIHNRSEADKTYYAKWVENVPGTSLVTLNTNGGVGSPLDMYREGVVTPLPTDYVREGYTFGGWYDSADIDTAKKVTEIGATSYGDVSFYARWVANEYTITFVTNGGVELEPIKAFCDSKIEERVPFYADMIFEGWYTDNALTERFVWDTMPAHDVTLYAKWSTGYSVKYHSNGRVVYEDIYQKETITLLNPLDYAFNEPDYFFDGWYLDSAFTERAGMTMVVNKSADLYAKWTHRSFLPYVDRFDRPSSTSSPIEVNNRRELIALVDYVMFNGTPKTTLKINYLNSQSERDTELDKCLVDLGTNALIPGVLRGATTFGGCNVIEIPADAYRDHYKVIPGQNKAKVQMKNALVPLSPKTRDASFDSFRYKTEYTYDIVVETSNQLFYALETGMRPMPKAGSSAERMMNKAKSILRDICDDKMSDFDKLYAIYCYMTENVLYDDKAASLINNKNYVLNEYDSWHLEGVFDHHMAVCDGISKAVTVLARIEGIPCIRVVSVGHAWNKVYVDIDGDGMREWYNLDATWGSPDVSGKEGFDVEQFLFADSYTAKEGRTPINQLDIKANTIPRFYQYIKFTQGGKSYDLLIENKAELTVLAEYVHDFVNANNIRSGTIVVSIKQTMSASADAFGREFATAMHKQDMKKIGDIDLGSPAMTETKTDVVMIMFNI